MKPLIILHGWSDNSTSFKPLANFLQERLQRPASIINLADYITLDDDVTFDDIVAAMTRAWEVNQLPTTPGSVDAVVHSAGGLVIRDWLSRHYQPDQSPLDHLVMLAPANFGSPLAHKGNAFIGRVISGFKGDKLFQVGTHLLKGLELGSPYAWQLAMNDCFADAAYYDEKHILCTILTGNTGYTGISAAANEDGSDGTVRVASANLNCALLEVDFSEDPHQPTYTLEHSKNQVAFGIMDGENHSTIAGKEQGFQNPQTLENIVYGLTLESKDLPTWIETLAQRNHTMQQHQVVSKAKHGFQNTVFFVTDQFNQHVKDYFIEFYASAEEEGRADGWFAQLFHQDIIETTHAFSDDSAYRSMYIDCTLLYQQLTANFSGMNMSLTALPEIQKSQSVGYRTFTDEDIGSIHLTPGEIQSVFLANRTLLVSIKLKREQMPQVFSFEKL